MREPTCQCSPSPWSRAFLPAPLILQLCVMLRELACWVEEWSCFCSEGVLTSDLSLQLFREASVAFPFFWRWSCFHKSCRGGRALAWPDWCRSSCSFCPIAQPWRPVSGLPVPCPYLKGIGLGVALCWHVIPAITKPEGNGK